MKMAVKVTLLNYTPNPEQTVAMAAKLCYSPSGIEDIRDGLTEEKTAAFIGKTYFTDTRAKCPKIPL